MRHIIGDVHGCIFTLKKLIAKIRDKDKEPKFFFTGDYVDRGMHSKEMIQYLIRLQKKGAVCIRGNHDDVVDYLVNGWSESDPPEWVTIPPTTEKIVSWWMRHGLNTTCLSYGMTLPHMSYHPYGIRVSGPDSDLVVKQLKEAMPESHKRFLRDLKVWHEEPDFFIMHGFLSPNKTLPFDFKFLKQNPNESLWSKFDDHIMLNPDFPIAWDKRGFFGHTPVPILGFDRPIIWDKIGFVDMGSFMGKGMAAYCPDNNSVVFVDSDRRDLSSRWS